MMQTKEDVDKNVRTMPSRQRPNTKNRAGTTKPKLKKIKPPAEDDFEPTAHFEPVITLPDLIEVKTGEENETILFENHAKLYRYVKESKEWKERGIGNIKVMVNKDDPNKVRLLMRRKQVLKLCCNQFVKKDTKFNEMPNTETVLTWFGHDFSESELQVEILSIWFETADLCKQFHSAILTAQANMMSETEQIMKSLNILKDDMAKLCGRVQNIEKRINEFFLNEETRNQNRNFLPMALGTSQINDHRATSMAIAYQSPIRANISHNSAPQAQDAFNQMLHNIYGQIVESLYQYLLNAATENYGQPLAQQLRVLPNLFVSSAIALNGHTVMPEVQRSVAQYTINVMPALNEKDLNQNRDLLPMEFDRRTKSTTFAYQSPIGENISHNSAPQAQDAFNQMLHNICGQRNFVEIMPELELKTTHYGRTYLLKMCNKSANATTPETPRNDTAANVCNVQIESKGFVEIIPEPEHKYRHWGRAYLLQTWKKSEQDSQITYCVQCDTVLKKEKVNNQVKWPANLCNLSDETDGLSFPFSGTQFTDIPSLKEELLAGINALNLKFVTKVQERLLSMLLDNPTKEFVIHPDPGCGISLALAIYALNKIQPEQKHTQILWVAVNIEKAVQIFNLLEALGQNLNANVQITIASDGSFVQPSGGHIVVGTPKELPSCRILGFFDLKNIDLAIIDDADMIATSHNFLDHVLNQLTVKCQKIASSLVYTENSLSNFSVEKLWLKSSELTHIKQFFVNSSNSDEKCCYIAELLLGYTFSAIIYCNEKDTAKQVGDVLKKDYGVKLTVSIGSMDKRERIETFNEFANGSSKILVTTNMLSHGIDVPTVRLVVNFEMPIHSKEFLFRASRSGRLGRESAVVTFIEGQKGLSKIKEFTWTNCLPDPEEWKKV